MVVACGGTLHVCWNQRVNDMSKRDDSTFITGRMMLQHDEEMGDLTKTQFVPAAGGPFVDAGLCLL